MKLSIFLKKFVYILFLFLLTGLITVVKGQNEDNQKNEFVNVKIKVVDETDSPIKDVLIDVEGIHQFFTDKNGDVSFNSENQDIVSIKKPGYADYIFVAQDLKNKGVIQMEEQDLYLSSDDDIPMPFQTIKRRHITSGSQVIRGEDLEKYPSTDIRNSFTGLATGLQVVENNGMPDIQPEEAVGVYNEKVQLYARGRNPIFMIDNVPTNVTEIQLDPQEIESVTVIKDIVGKAMYGPMAADGIIFIKTRRGKSKQNILKASAETGISIVDRFPQWTNGVDYANLNNLARTNNGYEPRYNENDIQAFSNNDPYDMYHPNIDFREMTLKNTMAMQKANISYEGGKDEVQFFTYFGYNGNDDLFKIGHEANYKRLNARSNLDIGINDLLSLHFNIFGGLTFRNSPQYDSGYLSKFNLLLDDINTTPPVAFPVFANEENEWYGIDPSYPSNPVGRLNGNGYFAEYGRNGTTNLSLNYDMKNIIDGLTSKTFASFDVFNLVRIGKQEQPATYFVSPSTTESGADTILLSKYQDAIDVADQSKLHDYYYQRFGGYQSFNYQKQIGAKSSIQSSLTYILSKVARDVVQEPERQQSIVFSTLFNFLEKASIHGVLNYSGSSSLEPGKRFELFPSLGASLILADGNASFINFFKVRAEAGILGYESYRPPYYYDDLWYYNTSGRTFGAANTGYWFGSDTDRANRSYPGRIGNPDLGWEKRKEVVLGFDALFFNHKLAIEINYFNNLRDGILTNMSNTIPYVSGNASTNFYDNYNKVKYYGVEGSIAYSSNLGGLKYSLGGNFTVQDSEILQWDEPDYRNDYQSRVGTPVDAFWGLTYLGKFSSDSETELIPQVYDEVLRAGDLKYEDKNGDGIVDNNDRGMIGHTSPRLYYALNLKLNYKNFDLTMIADGRAYVDLPLTNSFFHNGWGDDNYSDFVRDNIGGAYPRLTYDQVSNNFQSSDFWLTNGSYMKLQNVELAYTLPQKSAHIFYVKGVRLFARGANLLTITDVKYVDPESPNSGVSNYPLYKTFTGGIKITY